MVYNDYVICDSKKIKTPAIFIAERPDKNTTVIEFQEKLKEVPTNIVRLATHNEIVSYFKDHIAGLEGAIAATQIQIANIKLKIKEVVDQMEDLNNSLAELGIKRESLFVAKRMLQGEDKSKTFYIDLDISEANNSISHLQRKFDACQQVMFSKEEVLEQEQEYLEQLLKRVGKVYERYNNYRRGRDCGVAV